MPPRHQLDFTLLEPPDPMEKALDAVDTLQPGDYLSMLFPREPVPLFALLEQLDINYLSRPSGHGEAWELLAWHNGDREAEQAMLTDSAQLEMIDS